MSANYLSIPISTTHSYSGSYVYDKHNSFKSSMIENNSTIEHQSTYSYNSPSKTSES